MAHNPDKAYQAAQVYAARNILAKMREKVVILQEAEFFVDVDTLRDVVDPQGAAACVHFLLGQETPKELMDDPNVVGLLDELEHMQKFPTASLAVKTLFHDQEFRALLHESVTNLQKEYAESAGETPEILADYFNGKILIS